MKNFKVLIIIILLTLICQFSIGFAISPPSISNVKVKDMCATAQSLYWQYINNGLNDTVSLDEGFTEKDVFYYYIGTKEAFITYFRKVFTRNSALQFLQQEIKRGFLKEHIGELCHPGVGGGTIYTVSMGQVKLIKANGLIREYFIKAPGVEANDWSKRKVIFKYEEKNGWKIDSSPEILGF